MTHDLELCRPGAECECPCALCDANRRVLATAPLRSELTVRQRRLLDARLGRTP